VLKQGHNRRIYLLYIGLNNGIILPLLIKISPT